MVYKFKVYTKNHCPFCVRAKSLLKEEGFIFEEVMVRDDDLQAREELFDRSGMKTFPQIFFGEKLIGGFTELQELHSKHGLKNFFKVN